PIFAASFAAKVGIRAAREPLSRPIFPDGTYDHGLTSSSHPYNLNMPNPHYRKATLHLFLLVAAALVTLPAKAVIVRGKVITPFGVPLGNACVQLIQGKQVAAFTFTRMDGTYEIRSAAPGRFVLL